MKIAVIVAIDEEFRQLKALLNGGTTGRIGCHDVILSQCGIGKVNAAVGTLSLIEQYRPDCIISSGLAGGIDSCLHVMDVVAGAEVCYHDVWCGEGNAKGQVQGLPSRFLGDSRLVTAACKLDGLMEGHRVFAGLTCTGDQFITNREELDRIKSEFPEALAVDMESAAIAHVCHLRGVPFMSLRVISDTPGNTDNHQQQWTDFLASMGGHSFRIVSEVLKNLPEQF